MSQSLSLCSSLESNNKMYPKKIMLKIAQIAVPSVISNLIVFSLETINILFSSHLNYDPDVTSEILINAIGIGNVFMNFCGFLFGMGMITSLESLCSVSYGKGDVKQMTKWGIICEYFMFVYFLLLAGLCCFSKHIIVLLGQDEDIALIASKYVLSLLPSFLFQFYYQIYSKVLNSQQIYNPILYISIVGIVLHPFWCYLFFTYLQMPAIGLGISYSITTFIMLVSLMVYNKSKGKSGMPYPRHIIMLGHIKWDELKYFLKSALTCGVLCSTDVLGFEIISFIASYLPQNQLDANICVINIYNNIYSITAGFSTALTTLTGNLMGENKPGLAIKFVQMGMLMNFTLIMMISMFCIFFHNFIALLYIQNTNILKFSSNLMRIVGIFIIFDSIQLLLSGVIRAIGKQTIGMFIGVAIFIVIQSTLCYFWVFTLGYGVYGLWIVQTGCAILGSIVYFVLLKCTNWKQMAKIASEEANGETTDKEKAKLVLNTQTAEYPGSTAWEST